MVDIDNIDAEQTILQGGENMKRILVLAYVVSPTRGSEYSVAWNYITHMSKKNHLTVLYGASGDHMGDCAEMEEYVRIHPMPNVDFVPVYPNKMAVMLNWLNRQGLFVYTFYYAYRIWHKQAFEKSCELLKNKHFDLAHYVGMIGYREPGYLWKLGLPYIWGPVSGANNVPQQLMRHMPLLGRMKQSFRNLANTIQFRTKSRLKEALKRTDLLLTATSENQRKFKEVHHKDSICIPENCITGNIVLDEAKFKNPDKYNIIVIGTLDARKSVGILLEALTQVKRCDLLHLDIVGDGPLKVVLQKYAVKHNLNNIITWHGKLPRTEAVKVFNSAHLHVITSVSEGNPTTIWEAMSYGVPTLSFDHCGMYDTLRDGAGILVPILPTYEQNVKGIADAIDTLLEYPEHFRQLADKTLLRAQEYTWDKRMDFWNKIYSDLIKK